MLLELSEDLRNTREFSNVPYAESIDRRIGELKPVFHRGTTPYVAEAVRAYRATAQSDPGRPTKKAKDYKRIPRLRMPAFS